jgi:hypothetical protein
LPAVHNCTNTQAISHTAPNASMVLSRKAAPLTGAPVESGRSSRTPINHAARINGSTISQRM